MATIHMTTSELARDLESVLAQVKHGLEVVIEQDNRAIAVLKAPTPSGRGRKLSECIALAKAYEAQFDSPPTPDEDFAKDVLAGIEAHREAFDPPAWD